jgi:hypothetical protein
VNGLLRDLVVAAPLIFLGVLMVIDPAGLITWLRNGERELRQLEHQLQGRPLLAPPPGGDQAIGPRTLLGVRLFGGLLIAVAVGCVLAR